MRATWTPASRASASPSTWAARPPRREARPRGARWPAPSPKSGERFQNHAGRERAGDVGARSAGVERSQGRRSRQGRGVCRRVASCNGCHGSGAILVPIGTKCLFFPSVFSLFGFQLIHIRIHFVFVFVYVCVFIFLHVCIFVYIRI